MNVTARKPLAAPGSAGGSAPSSLQPLASSLSFPVTVRIDTPVELDYYRNGGILQTVLRKLLKS
jgi:hypothetical protein